MRDHDQRAAAAQSRQRLGDDVLVLGVQRGGRLVHQQDGSILEQRAGDGDALALAARQARAAFADRSVHALRQARDDLRHAGLARGLHEFGLGGVGLADADVVGDAAREQIAVLEDLAELAGQLRARHPAHVDAADQHAALAGVEEARDQPRQRGLPDPDGPISAVMLPGAMRRSMPRSTSAASGA